MIQQKLPLLVLYESGESWYVRDDKPIAIFLKPDEIACYAYEFPKMPYSYAKSVCEELDTGNFFWHIPNVKELQALLDNWRAVNETAKLIGADILHLSRYLGSKKIDDKTRLGLNLALEREEELDIDQYAYLRPFMYL